MSHFGILIEKASTIFQVGKNRKRPLHLGKTFKRNLFLKPNFLQRFGVKRQMDVFGQCPFPRLGRQGIEKTEKYRGAENTAALHSNKQPPSVQLPPALRATRAA